MSFLLGLLPELAGAIGTVGTAVAEETGSSVLAGVVTGAITNAINNAADEIGKQTVDAIFGAGTTEQIGTEAAKIKEEAGAFSFFDPFTMDTNQLVNKLKKTKTNKEQADDLAHMVNDVSNQMAVDPNFSVIEEKYDPGFFKSSVTKLISNSPIYGYLMPAISEYASKLVVPDNEQYAEIARVYNGRSINTEDVFIEIVDGFKTFNIYDETGAKQTWNTKWNLEYKSIPSIHGIYVGKNSINNAKPIDLIDTFCMLHDIIYTRPDQGGLGAFNLVGDYQLISRSVQNKDRMTPEEINVANIAVNYFATAGALARGMFGPDQTEIQANQNITKISPNVFGDQLVYTDAKPTIIDYILPNATPAEKIEFTKDFNDKLEELSYSSSVVTVGSSSGAMSERLRILNILDNLELELD